MKAYGCIVAMLAALSVAASPEKEATSAPASRPAGEPVKLTGDLLGCWRHTKDPKTMMRFEPSRVCTLSGGKLTIGTVRRYEKGVVVIHSYGLEIPLRVRVKGRFLTLTALLHFLQKSITLEACIGPSFSTQARDEEHHSSVSLIIESFY